MGVIISIFEFIGNCISTTWDTLTSIYDSFMAIFDGFASFFDSLFSNLGIYDVLASSLDTVTSLANQLSQYVTLDGFTSTVASFVALDTLFTVVLTSLTATVGVLLAALSFVLVTVVPLFLGWLAVKGVLRLVRLCTAGFLKA